MNTRKLNPCPYCGGNAELWIDDGGVYCFCTYCNARGPEVDVYREDAEKEAVTAWNELFLDGVLRFYYVESIDEYWVGQRVDNLYYATWDGSHFVWQYSKHLPWGKTLDGFEYPSEPVEIPVSIWVRGFVEKACNSLHWTTKTPTEEGWYWNRAAGKATIIVKLYYDSYDEYRYRVAGLPDEGGLVEDLADEFGCEWAGPIPEPKESKDD